MKNLLIIILLITVCTQPLKAADNPTGGDAIDFAMKYNKLEAAVYTYYAKKNKLPEVDGNGRVKIQEFYDMKLLEPSDLVFNGYKQELYICGKTNNPPYPEYAANSICAAGKIPLRYACFTEYYKDDGGYSLGEGRLAGKDYSPPCENNPLTLVEYIYRVF